MSIDITTLSPSDLAAIYKMMKDSEAAERAARRADREKGRTFCGGLVRGIMSFGLPARVMKSGAEGWSIGGKDIPVATPGPVGEDGQPTTVMRMARVQLLIRWEDTIPAGDTSGDDPED